MLLEGAEGMTRNGMWQTTLEQKTPFPASSVCTPHAALHSTDPHPRQSSCEWMGEEEWTSVELSSKLPFRELTSAQRQPEKGTSTSDGSSCSLAPVGMTHQIEMIFSVACRTKAERKADPNRAKTSSDCEIWIVQVMEKCSTCAPLSDHPHHPLRSHPSFPHSALYHHRLHRLSAYKPLPTLPRCTIPLYLRSRISVHTTAVPSILNPHTMWLDRSPLKEYRNQLVELFVLHRTHRIANESSVGSSGATVIVPRSNEDAAGTPTSKDLANRRVHIALFTSPEHKDGTNQRECSTLQPFNLVFFIHVLFVGREWRGPVFEQANCIVIRHSSSPSCSSGGDSSCCLVSLTPTQNEWGDHLNLIRHFT
ncbi:hypothetical protein BLNAU_20617 [Blattamonas nauphoetae]|uniref:Uncharacterized protein n=1 Tax=Blattamonas nauphoetae TaxID=2049346 RepID=A0ABQ9WZC1_9EUKA|nr:hypothetical protein BLNAU_20617 [Blattamonas nauphoetae]